MMPPLPPGAAAAGPSPVRILVVDDEPDVREVVARMLVAEGYLCRTARHARDAWQQLRREPFDLLMTDLRLPRVSGLELLKRTRQRFGDQVAVIVFTAVDDRQTAVETLRHGAYGYLVKPVEASELIISVINALERRRLAIESQQNERLLQDRISERTAEVRRREEEIALRLVAASEYRDEETGAHIRRIGRLTALLAQALGWPPPAVDDIRVAAPMHDIGKIGVPDSILHKPGRLTPAEFEAVKCHTVIGASILNGSDVPLLQMAKDIALAHHERWDGSGYPACLAGKAIPESARLVAIADVYDALVHDRVYRPAFTETEALAIMRRERGRHFDPELFDCFLRVLPDFRPIARDLGSDSLSANAAPRGPAG